MRHDVGRWAQELGHALEEACADADAPLGDLEWHLDRARDTVRMGGELQRASLLYLVRDLASLLRSYPVSVPQPLLEAAMTAPGQGLPFALLRTEALCLGLPGAPRWASVTMSAPLDLSPTQRTQVTHEDLVPADAFDERFAQLLSLGYAWINLSAAGLLRGVLVVMVETPANTCPNTGATSINSSGPPTFVQQRAGWSLDDFILFEGSP